MFGTKAFLHRCSVALIGLFGLFFWIQLASAISTDTPNASIGRWKISYTLTQPERQALSKRLAQAEVKMWQAYYNKDYVRLVDAMVLMLTEQFGLNTFEAMYLGSSAASAAIKFSDLPKRTSRARYESEVLPLLFFFYKQLKQTVGATFDPKQVAEAELDWWIVRRTPHQHSVKNIGAGIAKVYGLLYGKNNRWIQSAGYLRAKAAQLRARQHRQEGVNWKEVQHLLEQSYEALFAGISDHKS